MHADFYRVSGSQELAELGFDDLPEGAVVALEWPDRAGGLLPPDRIDLALTLAPKLKSEFRHARVTGYGACGPRVDRMARVRQFIAEAGLSEAVRTRMPGDASTRTYHRLALGNRRELLDELAAAAGRPAGARRQALQPDRAPCRMVTPFVAVAKGLRTQGLAAPEIHHADLELGLLIIEDLGEEGVVAGNPPAPIAERYETAVDVFLICTTSNCPTCCRLRRISITASPPTISARS